MQSRFYRICGQAIMTAGKNDCISCAGSCSGSQKMIAQEVIMNMSHEITPEQITPRFFAALICWQKQGRRSIDIKIPPLWVHEQGAVTTVWCYDYDLKEGNYATRISEIPTTKSLMQQRQKRVEKEKYDLARKLKELEAMA